MLTKENAEQILNSRSLISQPGKYQVKVTNVTPFTREDGTLVGIANYNAMTPYQLGQTREKWAEIDANEGEDFQDATLFNLSSSQRVGMDFVPNKGEIVEIVTDYVETKNAAKALLVIGCQPIRTSTAAKIKFDMNSPVLDESGAAEASNREIAISKAEEGGDKFLEEQGLAKLTKTKVADEAALHA